MFWGGGCTFDIDTHTQQLNRLLSPEPDSLNRDEDVESEALHTVVGGETVAKCASGKNTDD